MNNLNKDDKILLYSELLGNLIFLAAFLKPRKKKSSGLKLPYCSQIH